MLDPEQGCGHSEIRRLRGRDYIYYGKNKVSVLRTSKYCIPVDQVTGKHGQWFSRHTVVFKACAKESHLDLILFSCPLDVNGKYFRARVPVRTWTAVCPSMLMDLYAFWQHGTGFNVGLSNVI